MGCCLSCCRGKKAIEYDQVLVRPDEADAGTTFNQRDAKDGEIQEIASRLSLEPFLKERRNILKAIFPIRLKSEEVLIILRALKTENERYCFIDQYKDNIGSVDAEEVLVLFRGEDRKEEVKKLLNIA